MPDFQKLNAAANTYNAMPADEAGTDRIYRNALFDEVTAIVEGHGDHEGYQFNTLEAENIIGEFWRVMQSLDDDRQSQFANHVEDIAPDGSALSDKFGDWLDEEQEGPARLVGEEAVYDMPGNG